MAEFSDENPHKLIISNRKYLEYGIDCVKNSNHDQTMAKNFC